MTSTLEQALQGLNPQQKAAVFHRATPCLVKALAGSGKTKVLTCRAAKLVAVDQVPLDRILMVTFTKKAAAEMKERLIRLLEITDPKGLTLDIGTFHHVAARLLRTYATDVGIEPNYTILDKSETLYAAKACFKQKGLKKDEDGGGYGPLSSPNAFLEAHSKAVNQNQDPLIAVPEAADNAQEDSQMAEELVLLFRDYKRQHNVVDYDDLLDYWRCLIQNPRTADALKTKWDHVLVDEYQDTNLLQEEILRGLNTEELCVVGDAQQSIYGWRSAEPRNFTEFGQRYANAAEYPLEINYRSTERILDAANNILEAVHEKNRLKAVKPQGQTPFFLGFSSEWDEADAIIKDVRHAISRGIHPRRICVLTRTGRATLALEYKLNEIGIRYEKRGGIRITDRKEIKHCGAFARLMLNPKDLLAWQTALQLYPRIGAAKARDITGAWLELIERYPNPADRVTAPELDALIKDHDKTGEGIGHLLHLAADYHADNGANLPAYLERLHQEWLRIAPDNYEAHNLDERKEVIAKAMENWRNAQDLNRIIEDMALSAAEEEERLQEELNGGKERIVISTIHSAKGLEWTKVILMGAGDKQMPSPQAGDDPVQLAEEQRLVYVALTRAESELTVTYSRQLKSRTAPPIDQGPSRLVCANFAELGVQERGYYREMAYA